VDGSEGEIVAGLDVSHNLLGSRTHLVEVWAPCIGHIPPLIGDPLLSPLCRYYGVVSPREEQSPIPLLS
jgi:hypothetical protein